MGNSRTLASWLDSLGHLPECLRDFHDQKDIFKAVGGMEAESLGGPISWPLGHCYVIDRFLWFMGRHGYTLQKSRAKVDFNCLSDTLADRRDSEASLLKSLLRGNKVNDE